MSRIHGVDSMTRVAAPTCPRPAESPKAPDRGADVKKAAAQFEAVFVRQLLEAAKLMGPSDKGGGQYGTFAVEALADGVVRAGGLGLAQVIEASMAQVLATPNETGSTREK